MSGQQAVCLKLGMRGHEWEEASECIRIPGETDECVCVFAQVDDAGKNNSGHEWI